MLSRDWKCLARSCGKIFHSFEKGNPPCTYCGCVKVAWVPGGGHVAKVAPNADATLKSLAADYGLTNLNSGSHSRLNRAMPKYEQRRADMPVKHFAPGFSAPVSSLGATCQESEARVDVHGKVATNRSLPASRSVPGPQVMTDIAGRHTGRAG
jgi:hypothetical protein